MTKKNQSSRLTAQHKVTHGVVGIFGKEAKEHDLTVGQVSRIVLAQLQSDFPNLTFCHRESVSKEEINNALKQIDSELGQTLFVPNSSIIPDGASLRSRTTMTNGG